MADTTKKRGLSPEQWAEIRKRAEAGESFRKLAKAFGVQYQTISRRAKKEGWQLRSARSDESDRIGDAPPTADSSGSNVIDAADRFIAGKTLEQMQADGTLDGVVASAAEVLVITQTVKKTMAEAMQAFADDLKNGKIKPADIPGARDRSQVMKDALSAWKLFQSMFREDEGLKSGQPTMPKENDDGKPSVIELEIVDGPQAEAS